MHYRKGEIPYLMKKRLTLPDNHPSQAYFGAYSRVEDQIKHMDKQFGIDMTRTSGYDSAMSFISQFKSAKPKPASRIKPSFFPKATLTHELSSHMNRIKAFYSAGETNTNNKRPVKYKIKIRNKQSDKFALGCQYLGFFHKLEVECDRFIKSMEKQEDPRESVSRKERRSDPSNSVSRRVKIKDNQVRYRSVRNRPSTRN